MPNFASQPPSKKPAPLGTLFRGGMMPAVGGTSAGLIVFDLRSLKLPIAEGKAIEGALREALFKELSNRGIKLENRSAVDLYSTIFGIAIE